MQKIILETYEINPYIRLVGYQGHEGWSSQRKLYDYEMLYAIEGKGYIEIDGTKHRIDKGTMVLVPPQKPSTLRLTSKENKVIYVHFDFFYFPEEGQIDYADSSLSKKELIRPELYLRNGKRLPYCIRMNNEEEMARLMEDLLFTRLEEKNFWQIKCKSIFLQVLYEILNQAKSLQESGDILSKDRMIYDIIQYIHHNYKEKLTLEEIANFIGVSKNYANQLFKESKGYTIIRYLNRYRVKKAVTLIKSSRLKMEQIAEEVGFADKHYLSRMVKKETGQPPSHHRRTSQSDKEGEGGTKR